MIALIFNLEGNMFFTKVQFLLGNIYTFFDTFYEYIIKSMQMNQNMITNCYYE